MELVTEDGKRYVEIGSSAILYSVYSTAEVRLGLFKHKIPLALEFLKTGECAGNKAKETARQINLLRDEFSKYTPEKAVYNARNLKEKPPWEGNLSPVITSCGNLYTTADGKDLLVELVTILVYADIKKVNVKVTK